MELYQTDKYMPGGPSLLSYAEKYGMAYHALLNHTKKHQTIHQEEYKTRELQVVDSTPGAARQKVIELMAQKVLQYEVEKEGGIKVGSVRSGADISVKDALALILTAAKHTDDVNAKGKPNDSELLKAMLGARSGAALAEPAYQLPEEGELA